MVVLTLVFFSALISCKGELPAKLYTDSFVELPKLLIRGYEAARLEEDWVNEVDKLRGRDVEFLSRYMPFGLAEKVHEILQTSPSPF